MEKRHKELQGKPPLSSLEHLSMIEKMLLRVYKTICGFIQLQDYVKNKPTSLSMPLGIQPLEVVLNSVYL